jgi:hypothetical protein
MSAPTSFGHIRPNQPENKSNLSANDRWVQPIIATQPLNQLLVIVVQRFLGRSFSAWLQCW